MEKFAEARSQFESAARLDPHNAEAHNSIADMLALGNDVPGAIAHYRRALAIKPDLAVAELGLGRALAQRGAQSEAAQHLQAAAASADASVREQAEELLRRLRSLRR